MQRLPLRLRLGLLVWLAGAVFAATLGWGRAEHARVAAAQGLGGADGVGVGGAVAGEDQAGAGSDATAGQAGPHRTPTTIAGRAGQRLRVQVEQGDTLFAIAKRYGVALADLLHLNRDVVPESLYPGQELALPATAMGLSPELEPYKGLFQWPLDAPLTSPFGPRWGRMHAGIDFAAEEGTPIRAARTGQVTTAGSLNDYGLAVILTHADGTKTLYGHCSTLKVTVGQEVKAGDVIALVGSTGFSTGPHLHFEIHVSDEPRNPLLLLPRDG
jgi:LysM repeat protein